MTPIKTEATQREEIHTLLDTIKDPCSIALGCPLGLVELGLVRQVKVDQGTVAISLRMTSPGCDFVSLFEQAIVEQVAALPGIQSVDVRILYADMSWSEDSISAEGRARLATARQARLRRLKIISTSGNTCEK
jgi:metal-sulfur cluster biosynthetic enzyme